MEDSHEIQATAEKQESNLPPTAKQLAPDEPQTTARDDSELDFEDSLAEAANRQLWFAERQLAAFAERGLTPSDLQCIGFKAPVVFAESRGVPDNAYVADLYEQVSFLGDLHRQIADVPNGGKVRLRVGQSPSEPSLLKHPPLHSSSPRTGVLSVI